MKSPVMFLPLEEHLSKYQRELEDIDKVERHTDKASSHTYKSTAAYLAKKETGKKCILFDNIRVKSSYTSVMDFCAFGVLKRALGKQHPRTLNELWKMDQEEWSKMYMTVQTKSLLL
ncbi:uncharacterized protein TNCV_3274711 [Trichonephila clavipes]|nr:uncharacterized protein TNCV_3274711 [Trichonephila clavipes]